MSRLGRWLISRDDTTAPAVAASVEVLSTAQGGTGRDSSGATGTARVDAGTWAFANVQLEPYALASLPAAGTAGRLARVTDDVRGVWMDQGSQWFSLVGEIVNVKEFGATGSGTTDDTTAITNAVSALSSYDVLFFPPGTYLTTGISITPTKPFHIRGAGVQASIIKVSGANYGVQLGTDVNQVFRNVILQDFSVLGDSSTLACIRIGPPVTTLQANFANITLRNIKVSGATSSTAEHVEYTGASDIDGGAGIYVSAGVNVLFDNVYAEGNQYGLLENCLGNCTTFAFLNCAFRTSSSYGVYLTAARSWLFTGETVFEANANSGIRAVTPVGVNDQILGLALRDVHLEGNNTSGGSYAAHFGNDGTPAAIRNVHLENIVINVVTANKEGILVERGRDFWIKNAFVNGGIPVTTTNSTSVFIEGGRDDEEASVLDANTFKMPIQDVSSSVHALNVASVGTDADTNEKTLMTLNIAANTLYRNGRGVRVKAWGTTANNANTKTIRLKIGGTQVMINDVTTAPQDRTWIIETLLVRNGSNTQEAVSSMLLGATPQTPTFTSLALTETSVIAVAVTGQNGTAAASDVLAQGLILERLY